MIKSLLVVILPMNIIFKLLGLYAQLSKHNTDKVKKIFMQYQTKLNYGMLDKLQHEYKSPPPYKYDIKSLRKRGSERAKYMQKLIPDMGYNVLELGCWDGMVSYELQKQGKQVFAIDNRDTGFEEEVLNSNVEMYKMDAHNLDFKDNYFNFTFSYDTMEHFANPTQVLNEAIRVTKNGGYIYLFFGPLYNSPQGLHGYRSITVPYCQHLFDRCVIDQYIQDNGLPLIDYDQINYKSLWYFRNIFQNQERVKLTIYREIPNVLNVNIIKQYPGCFNHVGNFDELIISHIEILLKVVK